MEPFEIVVSNIFTLYCFGAPERCEFSMVNAAENREGNNRSTFKLLFLPFSLKLIKLLNESNTYFN